MRGRRQGNGRLLVDDFRVCAADSAMRTNTVHPKMMLLTAMTTDAALPVVGFAQIPAATAAFGMARHNLGVVRLISHQAATVALATIPVVVFVPRLPASPAFATIPIVMDYAA